MTLNEFNMELVKNITRILDEEEDDKILGAVIGEDKIAVWSMASRQDQERMILDILVEAIDNGDGTRVDTIIEILDTLGRARGTSTITTANGRSGGIYSESYIYFVASNLKEWKKHYLTRKEVIEGTVENVEDMDMNIIDLGADNADDNIDAVVATKITTTVKKRGRGRPAKKKLELGRNIDPEILKEFMLQEHQIDYSGYDVRSLFIDPLVNDIMMFYSNPSKTAKESENKFLLPYRAHELIDGIRSEKGSHNTDRLKQLILEEIADRYGVPEYIESLLENDTLDDHVDVSIQLFPTPIEIKHKILYNDHTITTCNPILPAVIVTVY